MKREQTDNFSTMKPSWILFLPLHVSYFHSFLFSEPQCFIPRVVVGCSTCRDEWSHERVMWATVLIVSLPLNLHETYSILVQLSLLEVQVRVSFLWRNKLSYFLIPFGLSLFRHQLIRYILLLLPRESSFLEMEQRPQFIEWMHDHLPRWEVIRTLQ